MKNVLTLCVLLLTTLSYASKDRGGGDAILCYGDPMIKEEVKNSIIKHTQNNSPVNLHIDKLSSKPIMYDYYEATKLRGFPSSSLASEFVVRQLDTIYKDLRSLTPLFYENYLSSFITEPYQWIAEEYGVLEIDDIGYQGKISNKCLIVQVAYYDDEADVVRYDKRITDLFDSSQRTTLKLHEDIYKYYRDEVRCYNILLSYFEIAEDEMKFQSDRVHQVVQYLIKNESLEKHRLEDYWRNVSVGNVLNSYGSRYTYERDLYIGESK